MTALRLFPLLLLGAACTLTGPSTRAPSAEDRIAAECALLAEAALRMGPLAHPGLREGCPGEAARDTRPLAVQTASLRAANQAALPAGVAPGSRGAAVFRRMITRGVPVPLAETLAATPAFAEASR
ncbi:MAG: hypothetical protein Kow0013_01500 [Pararhodobacter sp.]